MYHQKNSNSEYYHEQSCEFRILCTKGEKVRDKINFAFFFLSAAANLVSHAKSCYLGSDKR